MSSSILVSRVGELLSHVSHAEEISNNFAERRHHFIKQLGQLVGAPVGFWGWGRGNPIESKVTPVAALSFGLSEQDWQSAIQLSLDADSVRLWSIPIRRLMQHASHVTVCRSMLMTDADWEAETAFRGTLNSLGMDNLLVSVNYYSNDSWVNLTLGRPPGVSDFSLEDVHLVDIALTSIAWMQPRISETVPPETFVDLTARQRVVLLNLLDGQSRKQIAKNLGITLHTTNDHVKAIYEIFRVNSVTELAARFLQSQ